MERDTNFNFNSERFDQQPFFNDRNSQKNDSIGNNSGGVRSERDEDFDILDDQYEKKVEHKMEVQNNQINQQEQTKQIGPVNNPALKNNPHQQPQISLYDIESNLSSKNTTILNFKKTLQTIQQCLNSFSLDELLKFIRMIMELPAFDETFQKKEKKNKKMEIEKHEMDEVSDLSANSETSYRLPSCGMQTIFQIVSFLTDLIDKCTQIDNMHLIPLLKEVLNVSSRFYNLPLKPEELIWESSEFVQNSNNDQRYQEIEQGIQNIYVSLFQISDEVSSLKQVWYFYFSFRCVSNCFKSNSQSYSLSTKMKVQCLRISNALSQGCSEMFYKFKFNQEEEKYIVTEKSNILKMQKQELEDYSNALFDFCSGSHQRITLQLSSLISTLVQEQNSMDKKSLALKLIDKLILNSKVNPETSDAVCKILEENCIVECFLKDQTHSQLLRKLPSIVKFLYDFNKITFSQVKNLTENAIQGHEQFFKVVQSIIEHLNLKDVRSIFQYVKSLLVKQKQIINPHLIGLVQSIVNNTNLKENKKRKNKKTIERINHQQNEEDFQQKMKENGFSENKMQMELIVYELFDFLYRLVRTQTFESFYISILCKHISLHIPLLLPVLEQELSTKLKKPKNYENYVIQILNHCLKLDIDSMMGDDDEKNEIKEEKTKGVQYNFVSNLVVNCNLYDSIMVMLCKNRFDKNTTEKCFNILALVTRNYKPLEKSHVETLWNILGLHASNQFEKEQFFQFIKEVLKHTSNLSEESAKHVFFEIVLKLSHEWFTPKIYDCFEILFIRLNEDAKLLTYNHENKNNQNHSYTLNSTDLIGIEKFFYIYFWAEPKVSRKVKDFLFKLCFFNSSPETKQKLSSEFIRLIMAYMQKNQENSNRNLTAHTQDQFNQHVNRGFDFFSKFIEGLHKQSDKNGEEQNLITVTINNVTKEALPPVKKTIQVNRNILLKQFKELIKKEINPQLDHVELINKGKPLKVEKMTLKELKIENRNTILVENMDVAPQKKQMDEKQLRQNKETLLSVFGEQYREEILVYVAEKYLGEHLQKICEWVMDEVKMKEIEEEMKSKNEGRIEEEKQLIVGIGEGSQKSDEVLSFGQILSSELQKLLGLMQVNPLEQRRSGVEKHWSLIKKLPINREVAAQIERELNQESINFNNMFLISNESRLSNVQTYVWFWLRRILQRKEDQFRRRIVVEKKLETLIVNRLQTLIQNQVYSPELYRQIISTHQTIIQGLNKNYQHPQQKSIFHISNLSSPSSSNQDKTAFSPNNLISEIYDTVCNLSKMNIKNQQTLCDFVTFKDKLKTFQSSINLLSLFSIDHKTCEQILSLVLFNLLNPQNRQFGSIQQNLSPLINKTDLYLLITKYQESFLRFYLSLYVLDSTRSLTQNRGNQSQIDFYIQNYSHLRTFLLQDKSFQTQNLGSGKQKQWLYFLLMAFVDLITFYEAHHQLAVYSKMLEEELFNWIDRLIKNFCNFEQKELIGLLALINKIAEKVLNNIQSSKNTLQSHRLLQLSHFVSFLWNDFIFHLKCVPILTNNAIKEQYYSLILKLSSSASDLLLQVASRIIKFGVQKRNHDHDNIDFRKNDFVGIQNLGCTCYINSLIQQLYHTRLPHQLLTLQNQQGIFELNHTFMQLHMSIKNAINIRPMIQQVKFYGQEIIPTIQQDVEEFLISLLDYIESCNGRSIIDSIFGGSYSEELTFFSETEESKIFKKHKQEHFYNVTLDIKGKNTLNQALVYFFRSQTLDDKIFCQELDEKTSVVKRSFIKHFPKIMIFTLKRFEFDVENMVRNKLNDYFEFPLELDLTDFSLDKFLRDSNPKDQMEIKNDEGEFHFYTLCGILIHSGSAEAGHYYSYIKREDRWYEFNDRIVTEISISQNIKEECFGGGDSKSRNAYMLFYEREEINQSSENFPLQKGEKMEIEEQGNAMDLELDKTIPLQKEEGRHHGVFLSSIPQDNYFKQLVTEENHHFIKERLVFDPEYRKFVHNLITLIREAKQRNPYQSESDRRKEYLLSEKLAELEKIDSIINPKVEKPIVHFLSNDLMEVEQMKEVSYEDEEKLEQQRRRRNRETDIVEEIFNENNSSHDFI